MRIRVQVSTCSCRHSIFRMLALRVSAWWISMLAPPGYANRVCTPSRSRHCTRMSAPLRGSEPKRSCHSAAPAPAREAAADWRTASSCGGEESGFRSLESTPKGLGMDSKIPQLRTDGVLVFSIQPRASAEGHGGRWAVPT